MSPIIKQKKKKKIKHLLTRLLKFIDQKKGRREIGQKNLSKKRNRDREGKTKGNTTRMEEFPIVSSKQKL